jgi:hypothetical protein
LISIRAAAVKLAWRLPQPPLRLLAAASLPVAIITVVITLALRGSPDSPQLYRQSLAWATVCAVLALVGVGILSPSLAYWKLRLVGRRSGRLRFDSCGLAGALLGTYAIWISFSIAGRVQWPWPPGFNITLSELVAGVVASIVGICISVLLTTRQIIAYASGSIVGIFWGLWTLDWGYHNPELTLLSWSLWGFCIVLVMFVVRRIQRP